MRCPSCRKKVHPDDIYCVFCGASLRRRSTSDPWEAKPASSRPKGLPSRQSAHRELAGNGHFRLGLIFAILFALMTILVTAIVIGVNTAVRIPEPEAHIWPEPEKPVPAEEAIMLDLPLGQWEGFSVTADSISISEYDGELELIYTAQNQSRQSIVCYDPLVTVNGIAVECLMYLELAPGETVTDYLWITTDCLQALGITHLEELAVTLNLVSAEDSVPIAQTTRTNLPVDFDLPAMDIQQIHHAIYNDNGLEVAIVGLAADPEYGGLTMYTLMKNGTGAEAMVSMDNARCGDTDLHLFGYYVLPPDTTLIGRDMPYDIPFSDEPEVTFDYEIAIYEQSYTETGTGQLSLIFNVDGTLAYISGSTGHERVY